MAGGPPAPVQQRRAADDRRVVTEGPVAGEFDKVIEDARDQVKGARALRVPRQLDATPRLGRLLGGRRDETFNGGKGHRSDSPRLVARSPFVPDLTPIPTG